MNILAFWLNFGFFEIVADLIEGKLNGTEFLTLVGVLSLKSCE